MQHEQIGRDAGLTSAHYQLYMVRLERNRNVLSVQQTAVLVFAECLELRTGWAGREGDNLGVEGSAVVTHDWVSRFRMALCSASGPWCGEEAWRSECGSQWLCFGPHDYRDEDDTPASADIREQRKI